LILSKISFGIYIEIESQGLKSKDSVV